MKKVSFEYQGVAYEGYAQRVGDKLWLHFQGKSWSEEIKSPGRKRKSGSGGATHPGQILSPMPGKVTKVFVQKGELVNQGDALLVMEAMKMEYTLKADISGLVSELNIEESAQVGLGQTLLVIKEEE